MSNSAARKLHRFLSVAFPLPRQSVTEAGPQPRTAVHGEGPPSLLARPVREVVRTADPSLPVYAVRSLEDVVAGTMASTRFVLYMIALFATAALALATVGLYGVVAYAVRQRSAEFGVRLALGARPAQIAWLVVRNALRLAMVGVVLGGLAAPWLARPLSGLLIGVTPFDAPTLAAMALVVLGVVTAASWWPARRAGGLNPADSLRADGTG